MRWLVHLVLHYTDEAQLDRNSCLQFALQALQPLLFHGMLMMTAASMFKHTVDSAIRGFHIYRSAWTPVLHEQLTASQEHGNAEDWFAVAVLMVDASTPAPSIVGYLPREIS